MADGAEHTHDPDVAAVNEGLHQAHDHPAQHAAGHAVKHPHHVAYNEVAQEDADDQDRPRLPPAQGPQGEEGNDVGDPQLHAGNGDGDGDLRLDEEDDH